MSRTVLVTGGAGFVGSHLIQRILERTDWHIVSVDSFTSGGRFVNLLEACDWSRERVTSLTHDLTVPFSDAQVETLRRSNVDTIFNVASRSHVEESITDPAAFVSNNVQLMINTLRLADRLDLDKFIHLSTDEVYGANLPVVCSDYQPSSPYAASKAAQEVLANAWRETYHLQLAIVNSANMIGERQRVDAFLPIIVRSLLNDQIIPIHSHQGYVGQRHYTYVVNVVDALIDEAHRLEVTPRSWLQGQVTLTNLELVDRVAEIVGREPRWQIVETNQVRPGYDVAYPDLRGSYDEHWNPQVSFDDGLAITVNWFVREESMAPARLR